MIETVAVAEVKLHNALCDTTIHYTATPVRVLEWDAADCFSLLPRLAWCINFSLCPSLGLSAADLKNFIHISSDIFLSYFLHWIVYQLNRLLTDLMVWWLI